jgi:hypothetical protein
MIYIGLAALLFVLFSGWTFLYLNAKHLEHNEGIDD